MPTITVPGSSRTIPVSPRQPVRMVADANSDWYVRVVVSGSESWGTRVATNVSTLVYETPSSVTRRWTFDRIQIQVVTVNAAAPSTGDTGGVHLNLCEGPTAVQWATASIRNEAMEEPPLRPWEGEDDDPPLGVPLSMPAANRDRMGTVLCETVSESGGPANLVASYGPGVFVDSAGKLGVRTPFTNDVRGLGPYPAIAAWYHGGLYFQHDFGKSRNLALTRVLYQDPTTSDVAVVRGDGRRNCYRNASGVFVAAAGLRNTLSSSGGVFTETTPSGRVYRYDSTGRLTRVVDLRGSAAYYTYDANQRLQKIVPITGSGALGLVPYLSYDGTSGLLTRLVLEDPNAAANNRTSYLEYDGNRNLTRIIGPELCITYYEYNDPLRLSAVTDPQGFRWYFAYDGNSRVTRVVDALGKTAYFAWNTSTPLATVRDRTAKSTYFRYNAFGSPEVVYNLGFAGDYYTYDGEGSMTRAKNRLLNEWVYEYDAVSSRISATDPTGGKSYFAYDAQYLLRRYIDPVNRTHYLDYDGSRNRTKWIDPLGNTVYYEYETTGLLRNRKDRRGAFTYFVWDAAGNVAKTNDALGQTTYFAYDSANERTAQVDPLGRISYFEYDKRGRVTKAVNPIGAANYLVYDSKCNLIQETDALLRHTYHTYDGNSNRTRTLLPAVDSVMNPSYWFYDEEERVTTQVNCRLFPSYFEYDPLGRRFRQKDAFLNVTYFAYTVAHELERQIDARGSTSYFTYDAAGRLIKSKDALANETYFGFNLANERVLVKDALSRHSYFQYDPRGWQRQTKNAIGAISYVTFDAEGNRERSIDPLGKTSYFTYDLLGRTTHTTDQLLGVSYMGYDLAGQSVLRVDELGAATYMSYDAAGRSQSNRDPAGLVTYMAYDLVGNLSHQSLDQGWGWAPWGSSPWSGERATTYFAYDALNRRTVSIDPYNNSAYLFYDRNGNVERQRNERNFTTYFTFDALDRRTHAKDPVYLASTYMGYDAVGNLIRSVDQQGVTTYMTYDVLNRVSFQHDPSGLLTYHSFDAVGNRTAQHLLLGAGGERRSSYWEYDQVNRALKQIAPDTGATYFVFDLANNQTRVVDPVGRPSYFVHDALNRQKARYNALLEVSYMVYDARSSVTREIDPEGRATYMGYDPARRLLHQSNGLGEFSYFFHDARGARTHQLNPRGYSTYLRYDLLGRNTDREDALTLVTYMGYDQVGNQVVAEDEFNQQTVFTYDGLDRATHVTDAGLNVTYVGYDNRGSVVKRVDANGRTAYLTYDAARRLASQYFRNPVAGESHDPGIYYTYNQASDLTLVDDRLGGMGVTYHDYDRMSRVAKKATLAGFQYYTYDLSGLRSTFVDPESETNAYVYDAAGRLTQEQLAVGRTAYFAYDRSGRLLKRTLPGNAVQAYMAYDDAGRLSSLVNRNQDFLHSSFVYTRDPHGQISVIAREDGSRVYYDYDELDRLKLEKRTNSGGAVIYGFEHGYDKASNRVVRSDTQAPLSSYYFYDIRNFVGFQYDLQTNTTTYYDYDNAGRMTALRMTGSNQSAYFVHDQRNQIKTIGFTKASGADTPRYFSYNGLSERVRVVDDGASESYWAYDGGRLVREKSASATTRRYRHNVSLESRNCWLGTRLEYTNSSNAGIRFYDASNQQGEPLQLVDGSEGLTRTEVEMDAMGVVIGRSESEELSPQADHVLQRPGAGWIKLAPANTLVCVGPGGGGWLPGCVQPTWPLWKRIFDEIGSQQDGPQPPARPVEGDPLLLMFLDEFMRWLQRQGVPCQEGGKRKDPRERLKFKREPPPPIIGSSDGCVPHAGNTLTQPVLMLQPVNTVVQRARLGLPNWPRSLACRRPRQCPKGGALTCLSLVRAVGPVTAPLLVRGG